MTDGATTLSSMTVVLTTPTTGDVLAANTTGTTITQSYSNGTLSLTGSDTLAHYQQVLRSITYNNTNGGPGSAPRRSLWPTTDATSTPATATININVSPVVLLNSPTANNTTTLPTPPQWPSVRGKVSVTDGESGNLVSLTASIASLHTGDVLTDSVAGTSITSSYNAGTGVLTFSGSDTLAHYQQVLGTVKYNNTTGSPGVAAETVSVVATDGTEQQHGGRGHDQHQRDRATASSVSAVKLFYDNSKFNKNVEGVGAGTTDDKAIDTTKTAYLPGAGTANFSNISCLHRWHQRHHGRPGHGRRAWQSQRQRLHVPRGHSTTRPASGPRPRLPRRFRCAPAAGTGGGDRVELTWTDGSITQEFLEVTVHADANTGLSAPYTFFYGSVIANTGTGDTGALAITSSTDENAARSHSGTATVTNIYDFNKDGFVNSSDENAARGQWRHDQVHQDRGQHAVGPRCLSVGGSGPERGPGGDRRPGEPSSGGDTGLASGLTSLLNSLKTGTLPPLRLDWLASRLENVNLNSGVAATIFEALAAADTKLTRSILVGSRQGRRRTGARRCAARFDPGGPGTGIKGVVEMPGITCRTPPPSDIIAPYPLTRPRPHPDDRLVAQPPAGGCSRLAFDWGRVSIPAVTWRMCLGRLQSRQGSE